MSGPRDLPTFYKEVARWLLVGGSHEGHGTCLATSLTDFYRRHLYLLNRNVFHFDGK